MNAGLLVIILLLGLAFLGFPIYIALGIGTLAALNMAGMPALVLPQKLFAGMNSSSLLAIPFFMLAGTIMNAGGVATRIFDFCNTLVGHIPGGLGHVNVFCSVIFAGMSGSALADTGGIGAIALRSHPRGRG